MSENEASFDDTLTPAGTWNKGLTVKAIDLIFRALKEPYGEDREFCFRSPPRSGTTSQRNSFSTWLRSRCE